MAGRKGKNKVIHCKPRLAKLITRTQNGEVTAGDVLSADDLSTPRAHIVGITGSTAAGKSTLIDKIVKVLRKNKSTVIVLAIDPTEEGSGGAVLGDTVRMRDHYLDDGVFLRSLGSRGASSAITVNLTQVIELVSHFADFVIVETAGAGQADRVIKEIVDTFIVLLDTRGDAINLIKSGHHRHADILVANLREGSSDDERFFTLAQEFARATPKRDGLEVPVFRVIASTGEGVSDLMRKGVYAHREFLKKIPVGESGR